MSLDTLDATEFKRFELMSLEYDEEDKVYVTIGTWVFSEECPEGTLETDVDVFIFRVDTVGGFVLPLWMERTPRSS